MPFKNQTHLLQYEEDPMELLRLSNKCWEMRNHGQRLVTLLLAHSPSVMSIKKGKSNFDMKAMHQEECSFTIVCEKNIGGSDYNLKSF
jgi:hypothetical protein